MATKGFQRAAFDQSTIARHEVVEAQPDKRIRVRGGVLSAAAAQTATIESGTTTLAPVRLSANYTLVMPPTDGGVGEHWFITNVGEALNISLSAAQATSGAIFYDIVD